MTTFRTIADLDGRGPRRRRPRRPALAPVAARYAVAITPGDRRADRPRRPERPDRAPVRARRRRARHGIRRARRSDRRRRPQPGRRDRAPLSRPRAAEARPRLRGLLPLLLPPRDGRAQGRPGAHAPPALEAALDYIRAHPEIWEVILTGGDPLVLPRAAPARRRRCARGDRARQGHALPHARAGGRPRARHAGRSSRRSKPGTSATYVVLHANHPRELTPAARAACARIIDAGIPMLSQTVLLRASTTTPRRSPR